MTVYFKNCIILTLLLKPAHLSVCQNLNKVTNIKKVQLSSFPLIASNQIFAYKLVDKQIASPFYNFDLKTFRTDFFPIGRIKSSCGYNVSSSSNSVNAKTQNFPINDIVLIEIEKNNTIKVVYNLDVFCNAIDVMDEIYMLDVHPRLFISFYGCKMVKIKKVLHKFEGVMIIVYRDFNPMSYLNFTFNVLSNLGISDITFNTLNISGGVNSSHTTDALMKLSCQEAAERVQICARQAVMKKVFINSLYVLVTIIFVVFLVIKIKNKIRSIHPQ